MKNSLKIAALLLISAATFTSCSKEKKFANRLEGTWNIDKVTVADATGSEDLPTVGSFTFKDDGKGTYTQTITLPGFGSITDAGTFTWDNTDDEKLTLVTTDSDGNVYTANLTVKTNEKEKQVWEEVANGVTSTTTLSKK
jgi:hypothetical protein